jgi:hypothetical protein
LYKDVELGRVHTSFRYASFKAISSDRSDDDTQVPVLSLRRIVDHLVVWRSLCSKVYLCYTFSLSLHECNR